MNRTVTLVLSGRDRLRGSRADEHSHRAHADKQQTGRRRGWVGGVAEILGDLLAFGAASTGFAHVALSLAPGVTYPPDSIPGTQEISFIHEGWWMASLLLSVPLFFFARRWRSIWLGDLAAVVLAAPQFWATEVNLNRWSRSGLGDGLESLAILVPWFMLLVFFVAAALGRVAAAIAASNAREAS